MLEKIFNAALGFLEMILGQFDWWVHIRDVIKICILAAELTPDSGPEKKQKVIDAVIRYFDDREIKIPIPEWLFRILLGLAIDIVINTLNKQLGHKWISKN